MSVLVRFAPSPTGLLHVGNARAAIHTWLFARAQGGKFLLRLDDTDLERSKEEYAVAAQEDLRWLGLDWDLFARQKDRMAVYEQAIQRLKESGRLYPCYETAEELALKRKTLLSRSLPPIYDRGALKLTDDQKRAYEAEGRKPHWRFKLDDSAIDWHDLIRGPVHFDPHDLSDPVLIREDGTPLYHICSVIDDIDFKVTHIIRGEDHVTNTAWHVQMFRALGVEPPQFAHLPLIADQEGGKLSKRLGSLSLRGLREEEGIEPMAIISLMARLGTSQPIEACTTPEPLIKAFSFEHFSRSTPKFDVEELYRLNARILHDTPFEAIKPRLEAAALSGVDEAFWNAVRPNLNRFNDLKEWWQVAQGPVTPQIHDPAFIHQAASLLPPAPWDSTTWNTWINTVKDATGRKGKELFMPIRQALTGMDHGPELAVMLPLIGRERALQRLQG